MKINLKIIDSISGKTTLIELGVGCSIKDVISDSCIILHTFDPNILKEIFRELIGNSLNSYSLDGTYRITSNNSRPLIIPAALIFQKKVPSTSNNSCPLMIPAL